MIYLDPTKFEDEFNADLHEMKTLWRPFDEYERLAANKVRTDLPANFPRVNDGSLASFLQETPMRVLAQLQTGRAKAIDRKETWLGEVASIIWANMIVPQANTQAPFLNKQQIALYRALVYGSCPIFAFFSVRDGYTGADWMVPYIKDVMWERKKHSDLDCGRGWLTVYYSELQIKNMIKAAKKANRNSENKWKADILQKVLDAGPEQRDNTTKNKNERDTSVASGGYRLITCFQRGVEAPFTTVAPSVKWAVCKETVNTNPCGDIPLINLYCYEDLANPLGRGQVELAGPTQNVLDYVTQAHMFATQVGLEPPITIGGDTTELVESSIVYSRSKKWRVGNAKVDIKDTISQIYQRFPEVYGLYKTQLMNILGVNDTTVSASAGNPNYSKTPAGIQQGQARTSAHDNYYRKRSDEAFGRLATIMLNIEMANMEGQEVVKLLEADIVRLRNSGVDIPEDDTELEIEWNDLRGKFMFYVDENSSKGQEDQETVEKLTAVIDSYGKNPQLMQVMAQAGVQFNIGEAEKQRITLMGIPNSEKIVVPIKPGTPEAEAAQQGQMPAEMVQQIVQEAIQKAKGEPKPLSESLGIKFESLTDNERAQVLAQIGIQADPNVASPTQQGLNLKAAELASKQHNESLKTALDVTKTAHQQTMDQHHATEPPAPPKQPVGAAK
jgi:hypothetical protein